MTPDTNKLLDRFHKVLVEEIRANRPDLLTAPFTIAEIYQELVPYRTHRDRLGVEMNGDYEHVLLRLLAGEGEYLVLDAEAPRKALKAEHESANPNTGLYREWAAADVRLNPSLLPEDVVVVEPAVPRLEISTADFDLPDAPVAVSVEALAPSEEPPETEANDEGALGRREAESAATAAGPGSAPQPQEVAVTGDAKDGESTACKWCRAELPNRDNLNYCPFCGTDVHVVPCPSCGEALEPDWRFCIACGAEVVSD